MAQLQRPLTRKEFVIQSLLSWREPWATLVDADDEEPTMQLERPTAQDDEAPSTDRASNVFDLTVVPRVPSTHDEW
jgi:hypothetical protein